MSKNAGDSKYQAEDPSRSFDITRSDGDPSKIPQGDGWVQYTSEHWVSKRWRGIVGTIVAGLCGWDINDGHWHLREWPQGYTLWGKVRPHSATKHTDYHLYGRAKGRSYTSPIEFVLHAFFLFSDKEHRRPRGCRCNRCTDRKQGEVNSVEFGFTRLTSSARPTKKDPLESYTGDHTALRQREGGSGGGGGGNLHSEEILNHIQNNIEERTKPAPAADRERDRRLGQKFRIGELVWASIPPIIDPKRQQIAIQFWPGIVSQHRVLVDGDAGTTRPHHSRRSVDDLTDDYDVVFLGTENTATLKEGSLLPYLAHWWPAVLATELSEAKPTKWTPSIRKDLAMFHPLPNGHNAALIPPTFENALFPLSVGTRIAQAISTYHSFTDQWPYEFTTLEGASLLRFQGCWYGPERLWAEDFVRITHGRARLVSEPWYRKLAQPTPGAESRGIVMQIRHFASEKDILAVSGPLYEIAVDGRGAPDNSSRKPLPPTGYMFRLITPPHYNATLPLSFLAGRYDYTTLKSPLLADTLNQNTLAKYYEKPDGESGEEITRILALSSLLPGEKNAIKTTTPTNLLRPDLLANVTNDVLG